MNWLGLWTLFTKEVRRFTVVFMQTIAAPVVSALLYLFIFSHALSGRLEVYPGVPYPQFLVPGLMMMTIIQNAFANTSSSLIFGKNIRCTLCQRTINKHICRRQIASIKQMSQIDKQFLRSRNSKTRNNQVATTPQSILNFLGKQLPTFFV